MHYALAKAVLESVRFEDYTFRLAEEGGNLFLQIAYDEPDVDGDLNALVTQLGRRWLIERHADPGAVVRTAFAACMASMEHRAREHFTYCGARVFGPHASVDKHMRLARGDL